MKKDAKIGLGIILVAVLLSALLIGKALQKRDVRDVKIPDAAGPAEGGGEAVDTADSTAGGGGAMDRLTTGTGSEDSADDSAADEESAGGSLAEAGGASSSGADEWPLSAPSGPPSLTESSKGSPAAGSGIESAKTGAEDETVGGWAGPSGASTPAPAATPTATPAAAPAAGSDFPYTVQANDSAWKLAKRFYGSGKHYLKIVKANPGVNFDRLKVGTKLTIPGRAAGPVSTSPAAAPAAAPAGVRVHTVVRGDSPYKLAKKYLGAGMRYTEILDLNPGIDPNRLKIGQKLNIPAR